jgi:tetratricopeptide (TPR) repeat protein
MYEHFRPSDDVFVDREEFLEWMDEALVRCKTTNVVLHLKGIGGIGKSSLLNHWIKTYEKTIRLDCEQYSELYQRLNILAKGAVLHGIKLQRFDILWQIRQRFVEGVEPVKQEGHEWAKEVVMAIPFIGSLASIGSAITAVGSKVTPKLKGKYSTVGRWLQDTLGNDHIEQLLQILWKEPRRAEFLYLSAFLEDINNRQDFDTPILFLLDHFEYVDEAKAQWNYRGQKINETQLWTVFLSNLSNCVGVLASRRSAVKGKLLEIEESELTELDRTSCIEMLELQGVIDEELQERIVSVSGGNPFVIDVICDMTNTSGVSISEIEDLRADTLTEVRLKVWRRLFREAEGLHKLINRAGIVPYFNERILRIISPEMTPDSWDRLRRLSFVNVRSDGTLVLHDLAEDLVRVELGDNLGNLVDELSDLLEKKYNEESDIVLLGLAISVRALKEPKRILTEFYDTWINLSWKNKYLEGLALCNSIEFKTEEGKAFLKATKSHFLVFSDRIADGEHEAREALEEFERMSSITEIERKRYHAISKERLAILYHRIGLMDEALNGYEEIITLAKEVNSEPPKYLPPGRTSLELSGYLWGYAEVLDSAFRLDQAERKFNEAIEQWHIWANQIDDPQSHLARRHLLIYELGLCNVWMRVGKLSEVEVKCKSILEAVQEPHLIGICNLWLSLITQQMSRPFESLEWSEKAMTSFDEMSEHVLVYLSAHTNYANVLHTLGRYSEALQKIEEDLRVAREFLEKAPEIYSASVAYRLRKQAILLRQTGDFSKAEYALHEALRFQKEAAYRSPDVKDGRIALTLNDRGVLYYKNDNILKAERDFIEGLELVRGPVKRLPEIVEIVECLAVLLNNIGSLYLTNGRNGDAEESFEEALAIYERLSKLSVGMVLVERATVLNNLGALLISIGEFSEAEIKLKESLSIRRELEERGVAYHKVRVGSTLNNLGILHLKREEYSEALDLFQEATDLIEKIASKSSLDCKADLRSTLSNQYVALSKIESDTKKSENILKRLRGLGVKKVESEKWILDEMESS